MRDRRFPQTRESRRLFEEIMRDSGPPPPQAERKPSFMVRHPTTATFALVGPLWFAMGVGFALLNNVVLQWFLACCTSVLCMTWAVGISELRHHEEDGAPDA